MGDPRTGEEVRGIGIRVALGPCIVKKYAFVSDRVRVGRDPECEVYLPDPDVSRFHVNIHRRRDHYLVADNDSSNGCQLNGRKLEEAPLASGDMITIGRFRLWVEVFDPILRPSSGEDHDVETMRVDPPTRATPE